MMTCLFTPNSPCLEDFLNSGSLYTWPKSNLFPFSSDPNTIPEVGRADIIKLIWIMSKRDPARWVLCSLFLEKESLSGWLSAQGFFFHHSRNLRDLVILFSSSHVSWLHPSGEGREEREYEDGGWGDDAVRKNVQKGKMFMCLTYRWLLISQGEVRAPADNDVCIMVLNGNGAGPAPSKANLPERHPGPAQQECDPCWGQLQEQNPKPLVSEGPAVYAVGPADSDSEKTLAIRGARRGLKSSYETGGLAKVPIGKLRMRTQFLSPVAWGSGAEGSARMQKHFVSLHISP